MIVNEADGPQIAHRLIHSTASSRSGQSLVERSKLVLSSVGEGEGGKRPLTQSTPLRRRAHLHLSL